MMTFHRSTADDGHGDVAAISSVPLRAGCPILVLAVVAGNVSSGGFGTAAGRFIGSGSPATTTRASGPVSDG